MVEWLSKVTYGRWGGGEEGDRSVGKIKVILKLVVMTTRHVFNLKCRIAHWFVILFSI